MSDKNSMDDQDVDDYGRRLGVSPIRAIYESKVAAAQLPPGITLHFGGIPSLNPPPNIVACSRVYHFLSHLGLSHNFPEETIRALVEIAQIEFDRSAIEDPLTRADRAFHRIATANALGMSEREVIAKEIIDAERIAYQLGRNEAGGTASQTPAQTLQMRAACISILDERIENSRLYATTRPFHKERLELLEMLKAEMEAIRPEELR
jgi:hypothetical protein